MNRLADVELDVLELGMEDYFYFFEILSLVQKYSPSTKDKAVGIARKILLALLSDRLVDVYRGHQFGGEEEHLSPTEAQAALNSAHEWARSRPVGKIEYRFTTSSRGEETWKANRTV